MCAQGPKSTGRLCRFPTQLEQFPVNAQRSPGRILGDHSKDQGANLLLTRLRPPTRRNLEIHVQYKRNPARSQFTTVRGATKTRGFLHPDQNVLNATQNSLCRAVKRVRGRCACNASSCWRRAKFSRTRSSRERKELTIHPRRCRSDTIMARIVAKKSESSFSQVIHSAGVRRFGEAQPALLTGITNRVSVQTTSVSQETRSPGAKFHATAGLVPAMRDCDSRKQRRY